jgi:hypothetical protein
VDHRFDTQLLAHEMSTGKRRREALKTYSLPGGRHDAVTLRSATECAFHMAYYVAAADSTSLQ